MKRLAFLLHRARRALAMALLCSAPVLAWAEEGHGHDHDQAPAAAARSASPRLEAHSDLFELVGIVEKGRMTVYLDRFATNEPVAGATIEFESGAAKGIAQPQADGTYLIQFPALAASGQLPFSFTVTAGSETDLLAGDLDLHGEAEDAPAPARPWLRWSAALAGALLAMAAAVVLARKALAARRLRRTGIQP